MAGLNAGGTSGGAGRFLIGLVMIVAGGYLFLDAIHVVNRFGFRTALFSVGGFQFRSGMVLVPFIFGVGIIFYNARNWLGWLLTGGALVALSFGVITAVQFRLKTMTAFDILVILVLLVGGIGLFLSSLRNLGDSGAASATSE
jgi:hypothetical protein